MHLKLGKCKHFSGIQHESCDAGIRYAPFLPSVTKQELPCFSPCDSESGKRCEKREDPTEAEMAAEKAERDRHWAKMRLALEAMIPIRKEYKGRNGSGTMPCPTGCGGTLRWHIASYNGHVHAQCSTGSCVSWME